MRHRILAALLLASTLSTAHADAGIARNDDQLRAEPSPAAATVAPLAANARLEVVERRGFWVRVRTASATGWLKLSSVTLEQRPSEGASNVSALVGLATGRTGSGNIVSAAGTRGISAGDLRAASPDPGRLAEVKKMSVSAGQAEAYAATGGLRTRSVAYVAAGEAARP